MTGDSLSYLDDEDDFVSQGFGIPVDTSSTEITKVDAILIAGCLHAVALLHGAPYKAEWLVNDANEVYKEVNKMVWGS